MDIMILILIQVKQGRNKGSNMDSGKKCSDIGSKVVDCLVVKVVKIIIIMDALIFIWLATVLNIYYKVKYFCLI